VIILKLASFCLVKSKRKRRYYKDDEVLKLIGSKIRDFRIDKEISQETLANECEMDYSQLNRMELGKVNFSISYLYRIARALNIDPKELL
jgi:ribosome-binding protein aMBF1 (putative translation factor)